MRKAIIGGSGFQSLEPIASSSFESRVVDTTFGRVQVFLGRDAYEDLVFLPRHGPEHRLPPHRINYRANIMALHVLDVRRVLASFAVGSLHTRIPPRSLVALDQFIDFTQNREASFYDGGKSGLAHTEVTEPYCPALRQRLLELAPNHSLEVRSRGTYVCTSGPRFETPAEVRMFARLGGDVVGMTGVPEAPLARELGIHYAGVALSINWAAGVRGRLAIDSEALDELRPKLITLFIEVLRSSSLPACHCEEDVLVIHPPQEE